MKVHKMNNLILRKSSPNSKTDAAQSLEAASCNYSEMVELHKEPAAQNSHLIHIWKEGRKKLCCDQGTWCREARALTRLVERLPRVILLTTCGRTAWVLRV